MSYGAIYKITNKRNGKCYIGATMHPKSRFSVHKKRFNPEEYIFEILAEYNSKEELKEAEIYWIWRYNTFKEGYNRNKGGVGQGSYDSNKSYYEDEKYKTKNVKIDVKLINILKKRGIDSGKTIYEYVEESIKKYLEANKHD